ncbi:MAG: hypothetical protein IJW47_02765, partial [Clostridia bacterium]|nr:hypothetical protein [Clostridia bacterium]
MVKILTGFKDFLLFVFFVFLAVILTVVPNITESVLDGIRLFIACVLPSLFPYFFITAILTSLKTTGKISKKLSPLMRKCFNVNGVCGYVFFLSVIAGYPMGAKLVSDLKNQKILSDTESTRAVAFCSTSSPVFLITSVGGIMFNSTVFGILLFLCNFLSAILVGIIFSRYKKFERPTTDSEIILSKTDNVLSDSVYSAISSSLFVGAMITLFYVLTEILVTLKIFTPIISLLNGIFNNTSISEGIVLGLFECTKGAQAIASGKIG